MRKPRLMRFKEKIYPIFDDSINYILLENIDLKQWVDAGVKNICVVLDSHENDRMVHVSGSSSDDNNRLNLSFNDLYDQIVDLTEDKLSILTSLYNRVDADEILVITNSSNINGCFFEYLSESNGYLIYHHQMEYFLLNEMGFDEKESIELRKSWNKKVVGEKEKVISNTNYNKLVGLMPFDFVFLKCKITKHNLI